MTVGSAATILESIQADILVSLIDFVACFTRDPEVYANGCHLLTIKKSGYELQSFIHLGGPIRLHSFHGIWEPPKYLYV
jgi:hypothetical protein